MGESCIWKKLKYLGLMGSSEFDEKNRILWKNKKGLEKEVGGVDGRGFSEKSLQKKVKWWGKGGGGKGARSG